MTLNYIPTAYHPSVRKTHCWILLNPPTSPRLSLSLSCYKMTLFCSPLVIFNGGMNISREKGRPIQMASQVQQEWEQNTASIFQPALLGVCIYPYGQQKRHSGSTCIQTSRRTQMQAHNMHLYELLGFVCSGCMEHQDLEGLSKGISHIVTFSWSRRAHIEVDWHLREQMRMCLMQTEQECQTVHAWTEW